MFTVIIYWSSLLAGILPLDSKGIIIVFENECNPTFSFQVDGPVVIYLGQDDLHDSKYDKYERNVSSLIERWNNKTMCSNSF
jgi:hypothetical protein